MSRLWEGVREGCGTCEFWGEEGGEQRLCRRHPPQLIVISGVDVWNKPTTNVEQWQPTVGKTDWCGEYKRSEA